MRSQSLFRLRSPLGRINALFYLLVSSLPLFYFSILFLATKRIRINIPPTYEPIGRDASLAKQLGAWMKDWGLGTGPIAQIAYDWLFFLYYLLFLMCVYGILDQARAIRRNFRDELSLAPSAAPALISCFIGRRKVLWMLAQPLMVLPAFLWPPFLWDIGPPYSIVWMMYGAPTLIGFVLILLEELLLLREPLVGQATLLLLCLAVLLVAFPPHPMSEVGFFLMFSLMLSVPAFALLRCRPVIDYFIGAA